eukprot:SAG31_NODE_5053_length_2772_cov_10.736251_3_plen_172_part_00
MAATGLPVEPLPRVPAAHSSFLPPLLVFLLFHIYMKGGWGRNMQLKLRYSYVLVYRPAVHSAADDQESASVGLYSRVHARPATPPTAQCLRQYHLLYVLAHSGGATWQSVHAGRTFTCISTSISLGGGGGGGGSTGAGVTTVISSMAIVEVVLAYAISTPVFEKALIRFIL